MLEKGAERWLEEGDEIKRERGILIFFKKLGKKKKSRKIPIFVGKG